MLSKVNFFYSAVLSSQLAEISSLWQEFVPPDSIGNEYVNVFSASCLSLVFWRVHLFLAPSSLAGVPWYAELTPWLRLTGVPSSLTAALGYPSEIAVLQSEILASGLPDWFTSLPSDAQNWIIGIAGKALTLIPKIASLEVEAGLITQSSTATQTGSNPTGTTPAATSSNNSVATSSTTVTASAAATTTKASSSAAPSSSSKAGAAPTGVVASLLGAIGILGVAIAL